MRAPVRNLCTLALLALCLGLAGPGTPAAQTSAIEAVVPSRGQPLDVPKGYATAPEALADLAPEERIARIAGELRERGVDLRPIQALALLDAHGGGLPRPVVADVRGYGGGDAGVSFELFRRSGELEDLLASLLAVPGSAPGLLWLASVAGLALFAAVALCALSIVGLGFARSLQMHGHVIGHRLHGVDPPAWPGVLLLLVPIAALPLLGLGPAPLLAAAGGLACMRVDLRRATWITVALGACAVALGPGLELWARVAIHHGDSAVSRVAWRADRSELLPGDLEVLVRAVEERPEDGLVRLALATGYKRIGDLPRALAVIDSGAASGSPPILSRLENLRGVLLLAGGELDQAVEAFERSRALEENAAVLYNLSQAYARGMRLIERSSIFAAARDLDPDLVSQYTAHPGANVHRFVIQSPIPRSVFLTRALRDSPASRSLAHAGREAWLGRGAPELAWAFLPFPALCGILFRRSSLRPCARCGRPVCSSCATVSAGSGTCTRCERLFARGGAMDPRLRRIELQRDWRRRVRRGIGLLGLSLWLPGTSRIVEGRTVSGALRVLALGAGLALVFGHDLVARPAELGALSHLGPLALGGALLAVSYSLALLDAYERAFSGELRG